MRTRPLVLLLASLLLAAPAVAESGSPAGAPAASAEVESQVDPSDVVSTSTSTSAEADEAALTGREIYERVVENRHKSFYQLQQLVSFDAGGATSMTELWTRWKDGRDKDGKTKKNVISKMLAKYTSPRGLDGVGYLVVQKEGKPNDQFIYLPSARRVRRINLDETIMGTDFSIEDIIPREIETATYRRLPDQEIVGESRFVIEVSPKRSSGSQYSRLYVYVDKARNIPVRTDYWDQMGVEIKRYTAPPENMEEVDGVWIARRTMMRNLIEKSSTSLVILEIEANAKVKDSMFTTRALESKKN
jgi:hypothetical protein